MRVLYEIDMEIESGDDTDLISIMDNMAAAIERWRLEGELTAQDNEDTIIKNIVLSFPDDRQPERQQRS